VFFAFHAEASAGCYSPCWGAQRMHCPSCRGSTCFHPRPESATRSFPPARCALIAWHSQAEGQPAIARRLLWATASKLPSVYKLDECSSARAVGPYCKTKIYRNRKGAELEPKDSHRTSRRSPTAAATSSMSRTPSTSSNSGCSRLAISCQNTANACVLSKPMPGASYFLQLPAVPTSECAGGSGSPNSSQSGSTWALRSARETSA